MHFIASVTARSSPDTQKSTYGPSFPGLVELQDGKVTHVAQ